MNDRIQIHGPIPHGGTHLCWESGLADFRALMLPFVCNECGNRIDTDEELEEWSNAKQVFEPRRHVWIVKVGKQYLSEMYLGSARCSDSQKSALRFDTEGRAYRAAIKTFGYDLDEEDADWKTRVVRLKLRSAA